MLGRRFSQGFATVFESTPGERFAADWLDRLQTALVLLDPSGRVVRMNASAEDLLAVSAGRAAHANGIADAVRASGLAALAERAAAEKRAVASQDLHWPLSGGAEWLDARAAAMPDGGILLELQDAAPRRRAMVDRGREARRALSRRVVQQLAHEIRNPLAGLRGAAQLLARREHDATGRELAEIVCHEADRLEALVGDLLGSGRPLACSPGNVHAPLDRVVRLLAAEPSNGCRVERDFDPSLPAVAIDEARLQQVLLNLARNALQAGAGSLVFRTRAATGMSLGGKPCRLAILIEVDDDGPGVPDELVDSLFFPLVTGRPDGSGLGLSIAQDIVDRHGGEIDHERRDERTVFRILLPVAEGSAPTMAP